MSRLKHVDKVLILMSMNDSWINVNDTIQKKGGTNMILRIRKQQLRLSQLMQDI
jgi:hypothetical protein